MSKRKWDNEKQLVDLSNTIYNDIKIASTYYPIEYKKVSKKSLV